MILGRKPVTGYKEIPYTAYSILRYKSPDNLLRHARYIPGLTDGIMLVSGNYRSLVGYIGWEEDMIISFEVAEKYRGQGIGATLLSRAIEEGCKELTVDKRNKAALELYKKFGFKIYNETDKIYYMKLV